MFLTPNLGSCFFCNIDFVLSSLQFFPVSEGLVCGYPAVSFRFQSCRLSQIRPFRLYGFYYDDDRSVKPLTSSLPVPPRGLGRFVRSLIVV